MTRSANKSLWLLASSALLGGCSKETPIVETRGECASVYQAEVCTWVRMRGDSVVDLGALVPISSIESSPAEGEMSWPPKPAAVLALPPTAQKASGFTHLTIYWEAMGHPPGPYLTPHFDFHFYTISPEQRTAMDCADLSKPQALATGYSLPDVALPPPLVAMVGTSTLVGLCVPQMGMHSLLTTELESTSLFRGTMVIGYYQGKPIFVEPMITKTMLLEKKPFDLAVPAVPGMSGSWARAFRAEFDQQQQAYRFVFSDFGS